MKKLFLTIIVYIITFTGAVHLVAQNTIQQEAPAKINTFDLAYDNLLVILAAFVIIGVILAGLNLVWALIEVQKIKLLEKHGISNPEEVITASSTSLWTGINDKLWNLIPKDREKEIELDHEYDGIRELDNSLPPWWVYLFYGTIIWAAVYLYYYHVTDDGGLNQEMEYLASVESAEEAKTKYLAMQADAVDENSVTVLTDQVSLDEGKAIYIANCAVCHGNAGEGLVGPNFTDRNWIHGGSISNIFSTIKYGVPEKGMISWKSQLRPAAMQQVASYILTFQGTNPPNQKAAEGEIYQPDDAPTQTPQDSTVLNDNASKL